MLTVWRDWGFKPAGVVVERRPDPPATARVLARLRDDGVGPLLARMAGKRMSPQKSPVADAEAWNNDVLAVCAAEGIPVLEVASLASPEGVAALASLRPDVAVHAGAGILRATTLAVPRLGTLNAHMGTLPAVRGMNATEWAIFCKMPVGCTVHLIDPGIDTGDILCTKTVDVSSARNLAAARLLVDRAQILLLGDVVRYVTRTGELPPRHAQRPDEGRQFHPMHPVLRAAMDEEMSRA
jgi:folate-dependent phosphoribosylglycinamide formyltransferase PurN